MVEVVVRCGVELREGLVDELGDGWTKCLRLLQEIGSGEVVGLDEMVLVLLDDREMARLHEEFLGDPTTTDVMTFEHGEILIGVEVAERQSKEYGWSFERELALYGIHGLLHLAGYDDREAVDAEKMRLRQEELVAEFFSAL